MMKSLFSFIKTARGEDAVISEDGTEARRRRAKETYDNATVAIVPALLSKETPYFEVEVTKQFDRWTGCLMLRFSAQPGTAEKIAAESEPIDNAGVKAGSKVGLFLDSEGFSHYFLNGNYLGKISFLPPIQQPTVDRPLYGLVDIYANTTAIRISTCNIEWTTNNHKHFPKEFKTQVKTLLLCHRSAKSQYISDLPKFVLLDIISILSTQFQSFKLPQIPSFLKPNKTQAQ